MSVVAIVPARLASKRFPRKVLADHTGRPLVQHVVDRVLDSEAVDRVVVGADHEEIRDALERFDTEVVLTSPDHPNGTSRIAEAATLLGLADDDTIVNVQGDEPEIDPGAICAVVDALQASDAPMATMGVHMDDCREADSPNIVKVVTTADQTRALYFSRARIPFDRVGDAVERLVDARPIRHLGLYAYRRSFLPVYIGLEPTIGPLLALFVVGMNGSGTTMLSTVTPSPSSMVKRKSIWLTFAKSAPEPTAENSSKDTSWMPAASIVSVKPCW